MNSDSQRHSEEIKQVNQDIERLEQRLNDLTLLVQRLGFETQQIREHEAQERRFFQLQVETTLERMERRLPSGKALPPGE